MAIDREHYRLSFLDQMGVQLVEARRLAKSGTVARERVALLLLDQAAETLLRKSAETFLERAQLYNNLYRKVQHAPADDVQGQELKRESSARTVSRTREKRVERDFNELVDFVFEQESWPLKPAFAGCVKVLHRFRNEVYHRDQVRPDVIAEAVTIYAYLVAHLLRHRQAIAYVIEPPPPGAIEFLGEDGVPDGYLGLPAQHFGNVESAMADRLLRDFVLDHGGISHALSTHLLGRLDSIERDLRDIADYLCPIPVPGREFAVRICQCSEDELAATEPPADFWEREFGVTTSSLDAWRVATERLADHEDSLTALEGFGRLEQEVASFERRATRVAIEVDRAAQHDIDLARGK